MRRVYTMSGVHDSDLWNDATKHCRSNRRKKLPRSVINCNVRSQMSLLLKQPALRREKIEELPDCMLIKLDDDTIGSRMNDEDGCVVKTHTATTFQATKGYGDVYCRV